MMIKKLTAIIVGLTLLMGGDRSIAASITLYDGASGVTPNQYNSPSPWLSFGSPNGGTQTPNNGVTTLDTSGSNGTYAGYSNYNVNVNYSNPSVITPSTLVNSSFPSLDRNAGYNLNFTVKINSQVNDGTNGPYRAGFSIIALSSDKRGIEIGFRNNDIFSQASSAFNTIGEQYTPASTLLANLTNYNLSVSGNTYTLTSGSTNILSGSLRDYTTATGFGSDVYRTSNFIFLGDDTTSARANVDIKYVALSTNTASVPYEFSPTLGILALAAFGGVNHLLKNKKS